MNPTPHEIGRFIRKHRRARRLRQKDLADMSGLSRNTISKVEAGEIERLSIDSARRILNSLGFSVTFHVEKI